MRRFLSILAFASGVVGAFSSPVLASVGFAKLTVDTPTNTAPQSVTVNITYPDSTVYSISALIPPGASALQKRNILAAALDAHINPDWMVVPAPGLDPSMTISPLPNNTKVELQTGATGEDMDLISSVKTLQGEVVFQGHFDPFPYGPPLQPAFFTAGLTSDLGVCMERISAQELNFQTDGPIICQALFQRLAPRAPQYGAQINYAGDRLEVYFDPAYTVTQGGIIFGTTSPSPGCAGSFVIPQAPDCNGNGIPDELDIANGTSADCNNNSIPDECDIASGTSLDANLNGIPDECECVPGLYGDLSPAGGNGLVNLDDLLDVLRGFADPQTYPETDIYPCTPNGIVNLDDILAELAAFAGHPPCKACGP